MNRRLTAGRALCAILRRFGHEEEGAAMITFALMITAILGLSALVTDVGSAFWQRRMVQNATDGAALAGASQLAQNLTQAVATPATTTSQTYALANGLASGEITTNQVVTIFNPNDAVDVDATRLDNYGMRYIVGAGDANIAGGATAIVAALQPNDLWPFGVTVGTDCSGSPGCVMKAGAGNSIAGNFGLVCFGGSGCGTQSNIVAEIENGYNGAIPDPTTPASGGNPPVWSWGITTEPGNKLPSAGSGVQTLLDWDAHEACDGGVANSCSGLYQPAAALGSPFTDDVQDYRTGHVGYVCVSSTSCPRVGVVPLIQQAWSSLNGNTAITVVGFACFYLTNLTGNGGQTQVYGSFLSYCTVSSSSNKALYGAPLNSTGLVGTFLWR